MPYEVSLDRLGETGLDERVVSFLSVAACRQGAARKPPKTFYGWQHIRAETLANPPVGPYKFQVKPSPVALGDPQDPEHNPFHAHVEPPVSNGNVLESTTVALYLQMLFSKYGEYRQYATGTSSSSPSDSVSWIQRLVALFKSVWMNRGS